MEIPAIKTKRGRAGMTKAERKKLESVVIRNSRRVDSELIDLMAKESVVPTEVIMDAIRKVAERSERK